LLAAVSSVQPRCSEKFAKPNINHGDHMLRRTDVTTAGTGKDKNPALSHRKLRSHRVFRARRYTLIAHLTRPATLHTARDNIGRPATKYRLA
jgi:hypothetical protein